MIFLLLASLASAAELAAPHFRAVEASPQSWHQVFAARRPVIVYWDGDGRHDVEVLKNGHWKRIARTVPSGWKSGLLPRGVSVRLADGDARSPAVVVQSVVSPAQMAALPGPRQGLRGAGVVDIDLDGEGNPWIASLQGGVAWLDRDHRRFRNLTRAEGLPSDRVVTVAATSDGAWVGTAGGLVHITRQDRLLRPDRFEVTQVLTRADGLPDDYVQALGIEGDTLWIGTYHGLCRLTVPGGTPRGPAVQTLLQPWSVFSVIRGEGGRMWAGYEGLRVLPDGDPVDGVPTEMDVYDLEMLPPGTDGAPGGALLATLQEGVTILRDGQRQGVWAGGDADGAYALARVPDGWLAAGGGAGLQEITSRWTLGRQWGRAEHLPSDDVNEVVPDLASENPSFEVGVSRAAWLGTSAGLARIDLLSGHVTGYPLSRLPAGRVYTHVEPAGRRALFVGSEGVGYAGLPLGLRVREGRWPGEGLVDLIRDGGVTWWIYEDRVIQQRRFGRDRAHRLPFKLTAAAMVDGALWVGGAHGTLRFDARIDQFTEVVGLSKVDKLRAGQDGTVWAISNGAVVSLSPKMEMRTYFQTHPPLDLWPDGPVVWVGTENGLDVLQVGTTQTVELLRMADRKVAVPAVAADGVGGCWAATDSGEVIHLDTTLRGGAAILALDPTEPPEIQGIVPVAGHAAWVVTSQGVFAVRRPSAD